MSDLIYEDNKSLRFIMRCSVFFFVCIAVLNVVLPILGKYLHPDVFNLLVVAVWLYGFLSSLGYFKRPVVREEQRVEYETSVPIVQIGILRVIQVLYHIPLKHDGINTVVLIVLVCFDVAYVLLLLLDKGSYYYETVEREKQDYSVTVVLDEEQDE